jgi:glucokinase
MQIVTQNDEMEVKFMHITIPSLHIDHSSLLGLGLGLGLGVSLKTKVRVEIFKDETDHIFMQIASQNDEIDMIFRQIASASHHF